ncbi:MAG: DUF5301 domain-containing protein [Oscillospiraceae bacterium]|jgi:beta-lactamase regulating signal transducer with metallopeptidase domain|nr:DUF5301 domain-containing protein [Oscillospiraceae bacterium]
MTKVFMTVLNMSVTAAFVIAALCVARVVLQKLRAPKWISYALWAVAGFRLAVPFTFESVLSLIPREMPEIVLPNNFIYNQQRIEPGIVADTGGRYIESGYSYAIVRNFNDIVAWVWLIGILAMVLYAVISYVRLIRRKDSVPTPFVYGFFKPKIHIPRGLEGEELRYVTLHEQTHIRRRDHIVKLFAFALLCVHWFNPLAWVAFVLLCADMEFSCDERVLRELGTDAKAGYSQTLLSLSTNRRILNASPLAFGEGGIKERVKNVLKFKKPARVVIIAAIALVLLLSVGFALNKANAETFQIPDAVETVEMYKYDGYTISGTAFIFEKEAVAEFLSAFSDAEKIRSASVNDYPVAKSYLSVRLSLDTVRRILYLYSEGDTYYIEEPGSGIYKISKSNYDAIYDIFTSLAAPPNSEQFQLPEASDSRVFFSTNNDFINPKFPFHAQLMNLDRDEILNCGQMFQLLKKVGSDWALVPFADGSGAFTSVGYGLEYGESFDYLIAPERFEKPLTDGLYRLTTEVWFDGGYKERFIVWAEFTIDKNAKEPETIKIPEAWYGNFNGSEMTLEQLKEIVKNYADLQKQLTVENDFTDYKGFNASSSFYKYNMLYPVADTNLSLQVYADVGEAVTKMNLHSAASVGDFEITAESYLQIDGFINAALAPKADDIARGIVVGNTKIDVLIAFPEISPEEQRVKALWFEDYEKMLRIDFLFDEYDLVKDIVIDKLETFQNSVNEGLLRWTMSEATFYIDGGRESLSLPVPWELDPTPEMFRIITVYKDGSSTETTPEHFHSSADTAQYVVWFGTIEEQAKIDSVNLRVVFPDGSDWTAVGLLDTLAERRAWYYDNLKGFTEAEIAAARAVVEKYFDAMNSGKMADHNAVWTAKRAVQADYTPTAVLSEIEIRFDPNDPERENYLKHGGGSVNGATLGNVIVFCADYTVSPIEGQDPGAWNIGRYTNWNVILIRENTEAGWLVDDNGY